MPKINAWNKNNFKALQRASEHLRQDAELGYRRKNDHICVLYKIAPNPTSWNRKISDWEWERVSNDSAETAEYSAKAVILLRYDPSDLSPAQTTDTRCDLSSITGKNTQIRNCECRVAAARRGLSFSAMKSKHRETSSNSPIANIGVNHCTQFDRGNVFIWNQPQQPVQCSDRR
jgi:hypothetical protein